MQMTIKANKRGLVILILLPAVLILTVLADKKPDFENWNPWLTLISALIFLLWLYFIDLLLSYYTLDKNGLHHHFKLFTLHHKWSSFTQIYISHWVKMSPNVKVICFNRGLRHVNLNYAQDFHPFRFYMFAIDEGNGNMDGSLNGLPVVKRSDITEFLRFYSMPFREYDNGKLIFDSQSEV